MEKFRYQLSSDFDVSLEVCISDLRLMHAPNEDEVHIRNGKLVNLRRKHAVKVKTVVQDNFGRVSAPIETEYQELTQENEAENSCEWSAMLVFPVKIKDLDISSRLCFEVLLATCSHKDIVLGTGVQPLFNNKGRLKYGRRDIVVSLEILQEKLPLVESKEYITRALKRFSHQEMKKLSWLDALTLPVAESLIEEKQEIFKTSWKESCSCPPRAILGICLPSYPHPVLFHDPARHKAGSEESDGLAFSSGKEQLVLVLDPSIGKDSPAELMSQKLLRYAGKMSNDERMRPNTIEKATLEKILRSPLTNPLKQDEKNMIWRFRYALKDESGALTKFLRCVDWADADEGAQAQKLMTQWAPIGIADALELLSPDFTRREVRSHAILSIQNIDDEELSLCLLQLVQALRYEVENESALADFLLSRAAKSLHIASALFWHFCSELEDPKFGARVQKLQMKLLSCVPTENPISDVTSLIPLQLSLVARLRHLHESMRYIKTADAKREHLIDMISLNGSCEDLLLFQCPCPLHPSIHLNGIIPEECVVFKSKVNPIKLTWHCDQLQDDKDLPQEKLSFIYKKGDDLRQDQLVLRMVALMDKLLLKEHMDLSITPYNVLPTSMDDGLIEFVSDASPLSDILRNFGSVQNYFCHHAPIKDRYGIKPDCLNRYIRSCAGYVVFTHVLGIGDRHNDNVMITNDGRLFHIDFGYFLGRDPKFASAPLVIPKAVTDGMGGVDSQHYRQFVQLSCEALNILRKSSNLILSMIYLMSGSSIPDIQADPDMAVLKVQERLRLDLTDEEMSSTFRDIIAASQAAVLPKVAELQHRVAQGWR